MKLIPIEQLESGVAEFGVDTVIHTACTYDRGTNTLQKILDSNFVFPLRALEAVRACGRVHWINTDTCLPMYLNTYALTKRQFCQWGRYYAERHEVQFINLQLEYFYGPGTSGQQFLTWAIEKLKRNEPLELTVGTQKRDFVYIDDLLHVYDAILDDRIEDSYIDIPVGTGISPSIREVVEYLKECTNSNSELRFGAIPIRRGELDSACDIHILREIGVIPQTYWKDGMKNII